MIRGLRRSPRRKAVSMGMLDDGYNYFRKADETGYVSHHMDRSITGQDNAVGFDWQVANEVGDRALYEGRHNHATHQ